MLVDVSQSFITFRFINRAGVMIDAYTLDRLAMPTPTPASTFTPPANRAPGDFDGDGKTDPAKFYPGTGTVWWLKSSTGAWDGRWLGSDTFTYVSGSDFDGDGKNDPAKFYPGTGVIWWLKSSTGAWDGSYLGSDTYVLIN
jgi:hypothetical protein